MHVLHAVGRMSPIRLAWARSPRSVAGTRLTRPWGCPSAPAWLLQVVLVVLQLLLGRQGRVLRRVGGPKRGRHSGTAAGAPAAAVP